MKSATARLAPKLPNPNADHYRLEGSERPMPRTTAVIDRGIGKPFLTKWAAKLERTQMLAELNDVLGEYLDESRASEVLAAFEARLESDPYCEVTKRAAGDFGTAAHALVEEYLRARLEEGSGRTTGVVEATNAVRIAADAAPEESPLVERAARLAIEWFEAVEFEPDPRGIEERLWSEDPQLWSAGTADAFGTANFAKLTAHARWNRPPTGKTGADGADANLRVPLLIDLKTSKSIGVSHKVQAAAYLTYMVELGRIEAPCISCILRVAKTEQDREPVEALLIHPEEYARYGGAFRFIRRLYNFQTQEESLERRHWREKRG